MRCVLGIDSGGTKCDALVVRDDGVALNWGHTGFLNEPYPNRNYGGYGRNPRSIGLAVRQAIKGLTCDELNIAGLATFMPLGYWRESNIGCLRLHPVDETSSALAMAGVDCGIVVLAGTGAVVYGRTREGNTVYLDGMGPMVGDYGSGFHIGSMAIRAAAQADWHPRHHTSLREVVLETLKSRIGDGGVWSLVEYMGSERDRAEVAALARIVDEEARKGDRIAGEIIHRAADDIAETVYDAVDRLGCAEEYTMIGTGSVASRSDLYWERLCAHVADFAPRLIPWRSELPAVLGMVLIVLNKLAACDPQTLRDNLFRSTREMVEASSKHEWKPAHPPNTQV